MTNPCIHEYRAPPKDIGETLARLYRETLKEPIPADMQKLLDKLK